MFCNISLDSDLERGDCRVVMEPTNPNTETKSKFEEWCLVELMGHNRIVGKCTEAIVAGCPLLRVDVPSVNGKGAFTRF